MGNKSVAANGGSAKKKSPAITGKTKANKANKANKSRDNSKRNANVLHDSGKNGVPTFSLTNDSLSLLAELSKDDEQQQQQQHQQQQQQLENDSLTHPNFQTLQTLHSLQSLQSLQSIQSLQSLHSIEIEETNSGDSPFASSSASSSSSSTSSSSSASSPLSSSLSSSSSSSASSLSSSQRIQLLGMHNSVGANSMDIVNDSTGYAASMAGLLPTGTSGLPSNASLQGALQSFNPSGGSLTFGSGVSMLSHIGSIGGSLASNIDVGGSTTTTTEGVKNQLQALQAQLQQSQLKLLQAVKTNQYHEMKKSKQLLDRQKQKDEPTAAATSSDSSQKKRKVEAMNGTGIDESSSKRLRTDDT